jgi:hypothetical protein
LPRRSPAGAFQTGLHAVRDEAGKHTRNGCCGVEDGFETESAHWHQGDLSESALTNPLSQLVPPVPDGQVEGRALQQSLGGTDAKAKADQVGIASRLAHAAHEHAEQDDGGTQHDLGTQLADEEVSDEDASEITGI